MNITEIFQHSQSQPYQPVIPSASSDLATANRKTLSALHSLTVSQVLSAYQHIPSQTAILGICDDSLPVLFDLTDHQPGPVLICGDAGSGKTALMQTALQTLVALNSPYEVKYSIIASNPEEWADFDGRCTNLEHCYGFSGSFEEGAGETISRLAEIGEQRRSGRENGAALVLMIDDLCFMPTADYDVRLNFEWLLKNGPAVKIWPVVSLPTGAAMEMARMVTYFRTRLIGHMPDIQTRKLSLFDGLRTESLAPGKQFAVRVDNQWLNFWLPERD